MEIDVSEDPLHRGARALRERREPGWERLSADTRARVIALIRPTSRILTFSPSGEADRDEEGSRTWMTEFVVVEQLQAALDHSRSAPGDITLSLVDGTCREVLVELVVAYGEDLHAVADRVRRTASQTLRDLLGTNPTGAIPVNISVVDVVDGDPHYE
ncbi:MAG: Asp23/Gls24 family envelope stress response protein [Nocardioidaceae bacterium]|nr:Asp23/Gls24 family envelope stress response protein [Nocardioidaceae bacterium]